MQLRTDIREYEKLFQFKFRFFLKYSGVIPKRT